MNPANPPIPQRVLSDEAAVELLRAWYSRGEVVLSMRPVHADPSDFGKLLAGVANQMAEQYSALGKLDRDQALEAIRSGWAAIAGDGQTPAGEFQ